MEHETSETKNENKNSINNSNRKGQKSRKLLEPTFAHFLLIIILRVWEPEIFHVFFPIYVLNQLLFTFIVEIVQHDDRICYLPSVYDIMQKYTSR